MLELPAGERARWQHRGWGGRSPPRYRLRERAELAPNKGMGEGWGGGSLEHTEHLRGGAGRVLAAGSHMCHPWRWQGGVTGAAGALSKKKGGIFFWKRRISPKKTELLLSPDLAPQPQECVSPPVG